MTNNDRREAIILPENDDLKFEQVRYHYNFSFLKSSKNEIITNKRLAYCYDKYNVPVSDQGITKKYKYNPPEKIGKLDTMK